MANTTGKHHVVSETERLIHRMLVEPARERQRTAVSKPPGGREAHPDPGVLRHLWGGFEVDCSFVAVRLNQLRRGCEQASWPDARFQQRLQPGRKK